MHLADSEIAPLSIDGSREKMIEEIVAVGDAREHLLDAAAIRAEVISFRHSEFPLPRREQFRTVRPV